MPSETVQVNNSYNLASRYLTSSHRVYFSRHSCGPLISSTIITLGFRTDNLASMVNIHI